MGFLRRQDPGFGIRDSFVSERIDVEPETRFPNRG